MPRVWYGLTFHDLIVFHFKNIEVSAMSKMRRYHVIFTHRNFKHFLFPIIIFLRIKAQLTFSILFFQNGHWVEPITV